MYDTVQFRTYLQEGIDVLTALLRDEDHQGGHHPEEVYLEVIEKLYVGLKYNATIINTNSTIH